MAITRKSWQDQLAIIDRTMRAISDVSDPNRLVQIYWDGIDELTPQVDYLAVSRRGVEPPEFLITRSARFKTHWNPWTQRDKLPRLSGGLAGEIAYANKPVVIEDLPHRLAADDPAHFYLEGYRSLIALPQYDGGQGLNVSMQLYRHGQEMDLDGVPMQHWQAGLFGRGTQNLVLKNDLRNALAVIDRELQIVGDIQRSLLPSELPDIPGFELAAHYATSARAGGDYYDFFSLSDGCWGIFIADVSGHGTPAAVLMAITHALAHAQPCSHTPPATLLKYLNRNLTSRYARDGTFVTAFYGVLDPRRRTLTYASGGHNPPRLVRCGEVLSLDAVGSFPLGITTDQIYEEAIVQLTPGDGLLLYTDGITEAMPPGGAAREELFGVERLDELLLSNSSRGPSAWVERICDSVAHFSGNAPPADDQTLVAMRCN